MANLNLNVQIRPFFDSVQTPLSEDKTCDGVWTNGYDTLTIEMCNYREIFFRWVDGQGNIREGQGIGLYMKNGTPVSGYWDLQSGDNVTLIMGAILFPEADTPTYTIPAFWLEFTSIHAIRFTML